MMFEGREELTSKVPETKNLDRSELLWNQKWELDCTDIAGKPPSLPRCLDDGTGWVQSIRMDVFPVSTLTL